MSSQLAPVLVNLFIGFHEQNWMEQATNVKRLNNYILQETCG